MKQAIEKMTWEEFLSSCDVSSWSWTDFEDINIVGEDEDFYLVKISITEILDQPDVQYEWTEDSRLVVDWGVPVIIENPDDTPEIFIKIWKTPVDGVYYCDGQFYFSLNEIE